MLSCQQVSLFITHRHASDTNIRLNEFYVSSFSITFEATNNFVLTIQKFIFIWIQEMPKFKWICIAFFKASLFFNNSKSRPCLKIKLTTKPKQTNISKLDGTLNILTCTSQSIFIIQKKPKKTVSNHDTQNFHPNIKRTILFQPERGWQRKHHFFLY